MAKDLVVAQGGGGGGGGIVNSFWGTSGDELLQGTKLGDEMYGRGGNDTMYGGADDDYMLGGAGNDLLNGGRGDDFQIGGDGDDIMIDGAGDDVLGGDRGADTYIYGLGGGHDVIYNGRNGSADAPSDRILIQGGITPADITLVQEGADLILKVNGTNDDLTVADYFAGLTPSGMAVGTIEFEDGTVWHVADVEAMLPPQTSTDGDDYLEGTAGTDALVGLGGNDDLFGYDGNDYLAGGDGIDFLVGGSGDDILNGGASYDFLQGEEGNDTYVFGIGSGSDNVYENPGAGADRIFVNNGVSADDITLVRDHGDLVLSINGTDDDLTIYNFFHRDSFSVESIEFAEGGSLDVDAIKLVFTTGTEGKDTLTGYSTDDVLNGLGGNDFLSGLLGNDELGGGSGNDCLNGAQGNDVLTGGAGRDVFRFTAKLDADKNVDTITDFVAGQDVIKLQGMYSTFAMLTSLGTLDAENFVASERGEAQDANDYIVYETDTGKLFYDGDGNGAGEKVEFALIGTGAHPTLTASDFVVFM